MQHVLRERQVTNCGPIDYRGLNRGHVAANTNNRPIFGDSPFPSDAVARISCPARSAMTSGKARTRKWVLRFDRPTAPFIEPLMGWTGGDDTLSQVELTFPRRESAVAYAERQGLAYVVEERCSSGGVSQSSHGAWKDAPQQNQAFKDIVASYLPFVWLQAQHGRCEVFEIPDLERALVNPATVFRSPNNVIDDPVLSLDCKREILKRWAWDEYLLQVASDEAMPEGREPSRLDEVKCALPALQEPERRAPVIVLHVPDEVRRAA
jgi:hypothetical protein